MSFCNRKQTYSSWRLAEYASYRRAHGRNQRASAQRPGLSAYCQSGWPDKHSLPDSVKPYFTVAAKISETNNLLMRGKRIVIPPPLCRCSTGFMRAIKALPCAARGHDSPYGGLESQRRLILIPSKTAQNAARLSARQPSH